MKVALVHDWCTGLRGGERVLDQHAALFPDAELYTLVHERGATTPRIDALPVHQSPLARIPGAARHYRKLLPLFPWAVSRLRVAPCDLVLSSSHAVAKGVRPPPGAVHVCYCFTPMRYVWDQADAYLGTGPRRALAWPLAAALRRWDRRTSTPERVHRFVAISEAVAERIRRHYGRRADVIHPPVDVDRFAPRSGGPEDFYLLVGGFVPYKREDLAIEAFRRLGRRLVVAGDGPSRARLEAQAPPHVRFVGRVDDATLADLYARCRALVYPQEEDFGIVPVEAQAAGRPVLAYGRGGALDTVIPPEDAQGRAPTGLLFQPQTPEALADAVRRFEAEPARFDPAAIRAWAERFAAPRYREALRAFCAKALAEGPRS
ncbi:MAG: glycosyltransferase [Myxococcota bacterium]|nr:glycosyltransferase [Myxococcota bacterium]